MSLTFVRMLAPGRCPTALTKLIYDLDLPSETLTLSSCVLSRQREKQPLATPYPCEKSRTVVRASAELQPCVPQCSYKCMRAGLANSIGLTLITSLFIGQTGDICPAGLMWLLSTDRAELHYFPSPERVPDGYAILSQLWDEEGENSFQDVRALPARVSGTGATPRHLAGAKIRNACMLAESHGHKWLWADMCCIDKTSSAELSEAINSMFRYYQLASVCYAYLKDVPSGGELDSPFAPFQRSRWHRRGWTLQELLAPRFLIFISEDWEVLGTKADLAHQLEKVTQIPATVLRFEEKLREVSIARRMSWAAKRETTRVEDEAYCLMGIFGITMPTLYGEGRHAFRRLQETIMQQYTDTTLFAWEDLMPQPGLTQSLGAVTDLLSKVPVEVERPGDFHLHDEDSYLFAKAPYNFSGADEIYYTPPQCARRQGAVSQCTSVSYLAGH